MSHTPGPWVMGGISPLREYEIGIWAQDRNIRESKIAVVFDTMPTIGAGDAHLIVAAPLLLHAAQAALNEASRRNRLYKEWPAIADLLMAAIAKAEGRST